MSRQALVEVFFDDDAPLTHHREWGYAVARHLQETFNDDNSIQKIRVMTFENWDIDTWEDAYVREGFEG